ncbi:MAG TPA: hypothetical protein VF884_06530 [Nitrososphaeraceae archaeon]
MATLNSGKLLIKKGVGKVAEVNNSHGLRDMARQMGIGHRRWATHGGVNDSNAHPILLVQLVWQSSMLQVFQLIELNCQKQSEKPWN